MLPAALYVVAIFVVGSLPSAPPGPAGLSDKALHLLGFALLAPFVELALGALRPGQSPLRRLAVSAFWATAVGGLLELWQAVLPHRSCELLDFAADGAGATLAMLVRLGWLRWRRSPSSRSRPA